MNEKTFYELFNASPLTDIGKCLEAVFLPQRHYFPPDLPELPPEPTIQEMWQQDWENLGNDMSTALDKVAGNVHLQN